MALPAALPSWPADPSLSPARALDGQTRGVLHRIRIIALECRAAARADLFRACALISGERHVARAAHARALVHCLHEAIGVRPVFLRPGVVEMSFDEAWVMRCLTAARHQDGSSFEFLLRSRIAAHHRRSVAFLMHGISDRIYKN